MYCSTRGFMTRNKLASRNVFPIPLEIFLFLPLQYGPRMGESAHRLIQIVLVILVLVVSLRSLFHPHPFHLPSILHLDDVAEDTLTRDGASTLRLSRIGLVDMISLGLYLCNSFTPAA
ncbi:hypothetical protein OG21DRAFT_910647 [Imleria badia]|nr:hypothetical protein OG21DRAFT_910647 [Imleria badia]